MITDRFGAELREGDAVAVRARIASVAHEADGYLELSIDETQFCGRPSLALYSSQVEKISGDHLRTGIVGPKPLFMSAGHRSPHWPAVRREHLRQHPVCEVCGGTEDLEVHHRRPFHIDPALELVEVNLITLCEKPGHSCHFFVGHLLDWHAFNVHVAADVVFWRERIQTGRRST